MAVIETQTTTYCQFIEGFAGYCEYAGIEEVVRRDQVFCSTDIILLLHTIYTYGSLPAIYFRQIVFQSVVECIEFQEQFRLIRSQHISHFLTTVPLITQG